MPGPDRMVKTVEIKTDFLHNLVTYAIAEADACEQVHFYTVTSKHPWFQQSSGYCMSSRNLSSPGYSQVWHQRGYLVHQKIQIQPQKAAKLLEPQLLLESLIMVLSVGFWDCRLSKEIVR